VVEEHELRAAAPMVRDGGPSWRQTERLAIRPADMAVSLAILAAILVVIAWWTSMRYARRSA
jgi:hypothetical protein